jgi:hypothetical protein
MLTATVLAALFVVAACGRGTAGRPAEPAGGVETSPAATASATASADASPSVEPSGTPGAPTAAPTPDPLDLDLQYLDQLLNGIGDPLSDAGAGTE